MWGAAWRAICIISTAPIAKLGATNTRARFPSRAVASASARADSSSNPVVPTTTWTSAARHSRTFWAAASGVVKSTTTSAPSRTSASPVCSAGSALPASSRSSAASTASHTVSPIRPAAPETATRITLMCSSRLTDAAACLKCSSLGPMHAAESRSGSYSSRGQLGDVLGAHLLDPFEHLVEREQRDAEQGRASQPRHPRAGRLQPEHHPSLDVLLGALQLLGADAVIAKRRELAADDLAGLAHVFLAGTDIHRDHAVIHVLLAVGADRVGEPALLADLAEQARGGRAAEDRVENAQREASLVGARDPRASEADVVLLGLLGLEREARRGVVRALARDAVVLARRRAQLASGQLDDLLVLEVSRRGDDHVRPRVAGVVVRGDLGERGSSRSPARRRAPGAPAGGRRGRRPRARRGPGPGARPRTSRSPPARPRAPSRPRPRAATGEAASRPAARRPPRCARPAAARADGWIPCWSRRWSPPPCRRTAPRSRSPSGARCP